MLTTAETQVNIYLYAALAHSCLPYEERQLWVELARPGFC
jgi:hypothetical protein